MHLDEERAQRLRHGELSTAEETAALEHLASCAECRRRVDEAEREEREVEALLSAIDPPAPPVEADAVLARAIATRAPAPSRHRGVLQHAAAFLLALGIAAAAFVAYAAPGSPLPKWAATVGDWVAGRRHVPASVQVVEEAGIAVAPGRDLLIVFTSAQTHGSVEVSTTDGADVAVHAPLHAASFTIEGERLVIDNRESSASFRIEIPRAAPRVEIRLGDRSIFVKEGARVTAATPADSSGSYLLPLSP